MWDGKGTKARAEEVKSDGRLWCNGTLVIVMLCPNPGMPSPYGNLQSAGGEYCYGNWVQIRVVVQETARGCYRPTPTWFSNFAMIFSESDLS